MSLGKKIRSLISDAECKQVELANYLNISPSRLSNYLSSKREPDFEMLGEIVTFFGTDLNSLSGLSFDGVPRYKNYDEKEIKISERSIDIINKNEVVAVPIIPLNAKKKGINSTYLPISRLFTANIDNPEENVKVFEVSTTIPDEIAKCDDYLVCAKCSSTNVQSGDRIVENGRVVNFFKFYKDSEVMVLMNENPLKEHVKIKSIDEIDSYYKVLWVIRIP